MTGGAPVPGRSSVNKQTGFRKFGCADTANLAAPEDAAPYTHLATRKRGLLNLKRSRFEAQSQRDCASKPRVARNELPWVMHLEISNPNGVVALCGGSTQPRGVAAIRATVDLIAPSQTCGWTTQSLALKMCIMFRSPLRSAGALHSAGASAPTRNTFSWWQCQATPAFFRGRSITRTMDPGLGVLKFYYVDS